MRAHVGEASPDFTDGVMLALYPDPDTAKALAVDGGLNPADMHVTVAYLGHAGDVDRERLLSAATRVAARDPIRATISGHARFTGNDDGDVIVALVDSPAVERLRRDVVDALTADGIDLPSEHGFCAHASLAYVDADADSPVDRLDPRPVTFGALSVVYGTDRTDLPFAPTTDGLAAALREAYAIGWAASGGPMTDRVRAGCIAAVEMGIEHADRPGILEATLHLGHLEGVWAAVYERREALHTRNRAAVGKAWRNLVTHLDLERLVRAIRRRGGLTEAFDDVTDAEIVALVLAALNSLDSSDVEWTALREAFRDAVASGRAEGAADALALAADQLGKLGFDFAIAFEDAYQALTHSAALWTDADGWIARLLGDAAADFGRLLAQMTRDEAAYEDMIAALADLLDNPELRALEIAVDLATGRALTQGTLDLYASEGVTRVDVITAGGGDVCKICEDNESGNPYRLANVPAVPSHPYCRCGVVSADVLPLSAIQPYLMPKGA
jgi:2'-5' RNA ligase